jgi:hypothetical protein
MAKEPTDTSSGAPTTSGCGSAQGSPLRSRFEITDDCTTVVVRNPTSDATPVRANTQSRTFTIKN